MYMVDIQSKKQKLEMQFTDLDESNLPIDIYFGDFEGRVYRLDTISGKEKWIKKPNEHPLTTITEFNNNL